MILKENEMTKTVYVCDCCGKEFPEKEDIYKCNRELRKYEGFKMIPKTWDLCFGCIKHLEALVETEAKRIKSGEVSTDYTEYEGDRHDS